LPFNKKLEKLSWATIKIFFFSLIWRIDRDAECCYIIAIHTTRNLFLFLFYGCGYLLFFFGAREYIEEEEEKA
jgi:hypothetical protein